MGHHVCMLRKRIDLLASLHHLWQFSLKSKYLLVRFQTEKIVIKLKLLQLYKLVPMLSYEHCESRAYQDIDFNQKHLDEVLL